MKIFRLLFFVICLVSLASLASAQHFVIHEVKDGDTLWDISVKYFKTPWLWMAIADYNNLKNPHSLSPQDRIKIPKFPQVKVTAAVGDVKVKRIGTDKYVNLREGDYIYPHDEIVVAANSNAQLEFEDKSIIQLKPETSVILKKSFFAEQGKAIRTKVQVVLGRILFKGTETNNSEFEIETPGVFCGVRGTEFQTEYTKDGVSRVSVFEGKVQASSEGQDVNIPAGCGSQIVKGKAPTPPRPLLKSPELIEPVDGFVTGILTSTTFRWKSISEAAGYHFELSKDSAFNNVVYEVRGTKSTGIVAPSLQAGRYYWHVSSIDELGIEGDFSAVRILKVVKKLQVEVVPSIPWQEKQGVRYTSPSCKYTLNPLDADTSIVRIMAAVDNENFYIYHGPIALDKGGTHTIRYKGVDTFGESGETAKFIVVVDNTPPEIKIEIDKSVQLKSGCFVQPQAGFSLRAIDVAAGVDEMSYKIDDGQWQRYSGVFSIGQEGPHRIGFQAKDTVGNQSKEKVFDVVVDNTPPEIKIEIDKSVQLKSGCFVQPQAKFSLTTMDNAAGVDEVSYRIDDGQWIRHTGTFSISHAGSHRIGFQARDIVGNQSKEKVFDVVVDNTPPEIKIEIDRCVQLKSGCFVHPQARFSLTAMDNAAGVDEVSYRIDDGQRQRDTGSFSIGQEGSHRIGFQARDIVGNQSKEKVFDVVVDNTPPKIKIEIDKSVQLKSGCFVQPQAGFSLRAMDNAAGLDEVSYRIDDGEWKRYNGVFSIFQEGIHRIGFRAGDTVGNQSKEQTIDVVVDNTPPKIKIEIDKSVQLKSGCFVHPQARFSLTAVDNAAGLDQVSYRIDDGKWTGYTGTFSIGQEGLHRIGFQAGDTVGNQSKETVFEVIVDQTPPEIKIEIDRCVQLKSGYFVQPQAGFSLAAMDNAAGVAEVSYKIDDGQWTRYSGVFSIVREGLHRIGFWAGDTVGNQSKEQVFDVTVDNTPPEIKIEIDKSVQLKSGCFVHPQARFSLTAMDNAAGVDEVSYRIDDGEGKWTRYTGTFSISQPGGHRIEFQARDTVGNQSKEQVFEVMVDNTMPEIKIEIDKSVQLKSGCFVQPQAKFSLTALDNAAGVAEVSYRIDDGQWQRDTGVFSIGQEGIHRIGFWAGDTVGNQSKEKVFDVVVDNTPPEIKIEIDKSVQLNSYCFVQPQAGFSLIAIDSASGVDEVLCRIDDGQWQRDTGTFSISQEGNHKIGFQAKDMIGNQSGEKVFEVIVDDTSPEIKIEIDKYVQLTSGCFVQPQAKFSLTAIDNIAGVDEVLYRIDDGQWERYRGTFSISQEGSHRIGFQTGDMVGNQSKAKAIEVIVDNTPPEIKIEIDRYVQLKSGCFVQPQAVFSLIAIDDASGVAEILCRIDNGEWQRYSGAFLISQPGGHRIEFQAKDIVGNQSIEKAVDVIVDNTPPEIKIEIDKSVQLKSGCFIEPQAKFSLTAIDDAAGVDEMLCKIDNGEWTRHTRAFSISQEGLHRVGFQTRDMVGNQSMEQAIEVIVDNTPPEIKIEIDRCVRLKSGCFVQPQTRFSLTATDNASGVDEVLCRIDDGKWERDSGTFSICQEGSHRIGFKTGDIVGNQSKEMVVEVIVDNTPPEIKIEIDKCEKLKSGCFIHPQAKFLLTAIDDAAGLSEILYRIDNGEWQKYTGVFSIVQAGSHRIGFLAVDTVGNQSKAKAIEVIVDNTPPEIKIELDRCVRLKSGCFVHPQTRFSLIAIDNAAGVDEVLYRIDNGQWERYTGLFSIAQTGSHKIGFQTKDIVGNQSKETVFEVIVDNTSPEIKMEIDRCVRLKSGCFVQPQAVFSLTAMDNATGVDEVLCRIDDGQWKRYSGLFSISKEGSHRIGFQARDVMGNQSKETVVEVIVDNTPPEIKIGIDKYVQLKSGCFVQPQARFSLTATDNAAGVDDVLYRIDDGKWKRYTGSFSIAQEGLHRVGFQTRDTVGNQSKETVVEVIVDNTPPETKIGVDKYVRLKSGCFVHPQAKFSLTATDNAAGVDEVLCRIDNGQWERYTGIFSIAQEGSHRIGFQTKDIVGNQSKETVFDVIVDHTPPEINIAIDRYVQLNAGCFVHPQTRFSLTAMDNATGVDEVSYRIDDGQWTRYTGSFSITQEGSHRIGFEARDVMGNQSKETVVEVIVDHTPPEIKIEIDRYVQLKSGCFVQPQAGFSLTAIDNAAGVAEVAYRIDDGQWQRDTGTFSIGQEGLHRIGFRVGDTVGNQSKEQVFDVTVDNTPPEIKIGIDKYVQLKSGCFVQPQARFSLTATDNAAGVDEMSYRINDGEWKRYTGLFSIAQEGSHRIGFQARDIVGNQSKEAVFEAIIDNTPPEIKIEIDRYIESKSGYLVYPDTKFSLIITDNAAGVDEVLCKIDEGKWTRYTGTFSIYQKGVHRISFQTGDTVGNQSKEKAIDVIVDNTQPFIK